MTQTSTRAIGALVFALCCLVAAGVGLRFFAPGDEPRNTITKGVAPSRTRESASEFDRSEVASVGQRDGAGAMLDQDANDIIATELPLELLGTMVGDPESLSKAVILDTENNRHMVLRLGDALDLRPEVTVNAIEPRRVFLQTATGIEVLISSRSSNGESDASKSLAEAEAAAKRAPVRRKPLASTSRLAQHRGIGISDELNEAMERMVASVAGDVEPAYDSAGNIDGLRAINISDGGILEEAGITREDVIEGVNGVKILDEEGAKRVLRDLANCQAATGMIRGPSGDRTVEITAELLKKFGCVE